MTTPTDPTPAAVRAAMAYLARKRWAKRTPEQRSAEMSKARLKGLKRSGYRYRAVSGRLDGLTHFAASKFGQAICGGWPPTAGWLMTESPTRTYCVFCKLGRKKKGTRDH